MPDHRVLSVLEHVLCCEGGIVLYLQTEQRFCFQSLNARLRRKPNIF